MYLADVDILSLWWHTNGCGCKRHSVQVLGVSYVLLSALDRRILHHPTFGKFSNTMHTNNEGTGYIGKCNIASPTFGYEVAFAITHRVDLLKYFASALEQTQTKSRESFRATRKSIFRCKFFCCCKLLDLVNLCVGIFVESRCRALK